MRRLSAVLVIVISFAALAAPPDAPVPAELLGKWRASGTVGGGDGHGHGASWFLEYTFRADGTFLMTGYPPISVEGKVAVPERDGSRLRIVLTKRKMGTSDWPDSTSGASSPPTERRSRTTTRNSTAGTEVKPRAYHSWYA